VARDAARIRRRTPLVIATLIVLVVAAAVFRLSPLWPGPSLPDGATRLHITTAPPHLVPNLGCPTALLAPVRVATDGGDLIVDLVASGEPVEVVWPSGWAAWRISGTAELVDRDGSIVGREGDVLHDRFVGGEDSAGAFQVCSTGD
jgi:hypothetical protein